MPPRPLPSSRGTRFPTTLVSSLLLYAVSSSSSHPPIFVHAETQHHLRSRTLGGGSGGNGRQLYSSSPVYALAEEHHHVVPHLIRFARAGILSKATTKGDDDGSGRDATQPSGALYVHVDSHSDGALPPTLVPASSLHSGAALSQDSSVDELDILKQLDINNFVFPLGYAGLVGHFVFVEPPWSNLFHDCYNFTATVSVGAALDGDELRVYVKHDGLSKPRARELWAMFQSDQWVESLDELAELSGGRVRSIDFTAVSFDDAPFILPNILENRAPEQPLILDVDLDAFGTFSAGSLATHDIVPDWRHLMRIAHTLKGQHCDYDADYWSKATRDAFPDLVSEVNDRGQWHCVNSLHLIEGDAVPGEAPSLKVRRLLKRIEGHAPALQREDIFQAVGRLLQSHAEAITLYDRGDLVDKFLDLIRYPFHVDPDSLTALVNYWKHIWAKVFVEGGHVPDVITVVRSPFYTPHHLLPEHECAVFDSLFDVFGEGTVFHGSEVELNRTGCLKEKPTKDAGDLKHTNGGKLWDENVHEYFWPLSAFDNAVAYGNGAVRLEVVNEHETPVDLFENGSKRMEKLQPGETVSLDTRHRARWTVFESRLSSGQPGGDGDAPGSINSHLIDPELGSVQKFGTSSGMMPVINHTPLDLTISNPAGSEIQLEVRWAGTAKDINRGDGLGDDEGKDAVTLEVLRPGETYSTETYHGHRFTLHDQLRSSEEGPIAEVVADARSGDDLLFDAFKAGSEL